MAMELARLCLRETYARCSTTQPGFSVGLVEWSRVTCSWSHIARCNGFAWIEFDGDAAAQTFPELANQGLRCRRRPAGHAERNHPWLFARQLRGLNSNSDALLRTIGTARQVGDGKIGRRRRKDSTRRSHAVQHTEDFQLRFE